MMNYQGMCTPTPFDSVVNTTSRLSNTPTDVVHHVKTTPNVSDVFVGLDDPRRVIARPTPEAQSTSVDSRQDLTDYYQKTVFDLFDRWNTCSGSTDHPLAILNGFDCIEFPVCDETNIPTLDDLKIYAFGKGYRTTYKTYKGTTTTSLKISHASSNPSMSDAEKRREFIRRQRYGALNQINTKN
jgi:hypothetical protein